MYKLSVLFSLTKYPENDIKKCYMSDVYTDDVGSDLHLSFLCFPVLMAFPLGLISKSIYAKHRYLK
jgi:hypothetical protein